VKELIETHLMLVDESPAKNIAKAIGMPDLDVSRELNRMIADGVVERAKRAGGGNEYVYWLTTRKAQKVPELAPSIDDDPDFREVDPAPTRANSAPERMGDAVDAELVPQKLEVTQQLVQLMSILGYTAPGPITIDDCLEAACRLVEGRDRLQANNAELERHIDRLSGDGPAPLLFVTFGSESVARRHTSLESAQKRAKALIKSGKEDSVLVLVPYGKWKRGAEWSGF
jgi:DNA-binding MarR family transcriptional regulator